MRAVDAGFDPAKIALIGISGWMNPKTELDYCREQGITIIWLEEIWERGTAAVVEQAVEIAGAGDGIYLSLTSTRWMRPTRRAPAARRRAA